MRREGFFGCEFGKALDGGLSAKGLARHARGDPASVFGRLQVRRYEAATGPARNSHVSPMPISRRRGGR